MARLKPYFIAIFPIASVSQISTLYAWNFKLNKSNLTLQCLNRNLNQFKNIGKIVILLIRPCHWSNSNWIRNYLTRPYHRTTHHLIIFFFCFEGIWPYQIGFCQDEKCEINLISSKIFLFLNVCVFVRKYQTFLSSFIWTMKKCRKNKLEEDLVVWISTEISDKLLMDFTVNFAKDI